MILFTIVTLRKTLNAQRRTVTLMAEIAISQLIESTGGRPPLVVRVEEIYIMSGCDVYEIMAENKNIDAIVLVGYYNRYTSDAKKSAKENGVALFRRDEFYGALHRTGKSFMNYVPRPKKDK